MSYSGNQLPDEQDEIYWMFAERIPAKDNNWDDMNNTFATFAGISVVPGSDQWTMDGTNTKAYTFSGSKSKYKVVVQAPINKTNNHPNGSLIRKDLYIEVVDPADIKIPKNSLIHGSEGNGESTITITQSKHVKVSMKNASEYSKYINLEKDTDTSTSTSFVWKLKLKEAKSDDENKAMKEFIDKNPALILLIEADGASYEKPINLSSEWKPTEKTDPTNPTDVTKPGVPSREQVEAFVNRMYTLALGRSAETEGFNYWSDLLMSQKLDAAGIVKGFFYSKEFTEKNLSDSDYLDYLYRTILGREPDADGKAYWLNLLKNGMSRNEILAGFVNSAEFSNFCDDYNIARGTMEKDGSSVFNADVRSYAVRMYSKCLGSDIKTMDIEALAYKMNTKQITPEQVAKEFFLSKEFEKKQLSNEDFITVVYETVFDREPDSEGKAFWVGKLNQGVSREEVLSGITNSVEFQNNKSKFGL